MRKIKVPTSKGHIILSVEDDATDEDIKKAIAEYEKVFTYAGTDQDDDAQLKIGLSYQSIGNIDKAKEEFQRFIDYFPGSEYYPKAKEALKQLSVN